MPSESSASPSPDQQRKQEKKRKREKKEKKRERKREKKRRREPTRAEAPLEEATADVAGREFCSALRLGHAAEVAALLQSRPNLLRMRICLPGESELVRLLAPATVWSVVHEAVFRCTTTGERMGGTALARLSARGALGVLASVLRSCDDQSLDASRLVPTDADDAADAADADTDGIDVHSLSADDAAPPKRRRGRASASPSAAAAAAAAASGGRASLDAPPADWLDSRLDDSRAAPPPPNQRARVVEEAPLHVAAWRGSQPAVEMLLIAGADLLAPAAVSGLLPVHVACDPRSPAYQQVHISQHLPTSRSPAYQQDPPFTLTCEGVTRAHCSSLARVLKGRRDIPALAPPQDGRGQTHHPRLPEMTRDGPR